MDNAFECVKEYKNIYNYATNTQEAYESADSLFKIYTFYNELRKTIEAILNKLIKEYGVKTEQDTNLFSKIELLYELNIIDKDSKNNFHTMRKEGNVGSHAGETMDTRSEQSLYKEKKKKADYLYKCLYVECYRFANDYMPLANGPGSSLPEKSSGDASYRHEEPKPKNSSVTYGTAKNSGIFTTNKVDGNFGLADGFSAIFGFGYFAGIIILILGAISGNEDVVIVGAVILLASLFFAIIAGIAYSPAAKNTFYNGMVRFGEYTLTASSPNSHSRVSKIEVNGQTVELINRSADVLVRNDGTKARCIAYYDTKDGFIVKVYVFVLNKHYIRYDVVINDQKVVEGEHINLDKVRKAEENRWNYITDLSLKSKQRNYI